jgi:predicted nucleic acid-binding protein
VSNPIVLDCSVAMAWCFEDECDDYSDAVLDALASTGGVVPSIWPLEVANVLAVAERRGRLKEADSSRFISLLRALPIAVEGDRPEVALGSVLSLSREFELSSYDAAYLELAMRTGAPLATRDKGLREACAASGVELFQPSP